MKLRFSAAVTTAALFAVAGPGAQAASILLYNTGVDDFGTPLANGASEIHYSLVSAPVGFTTAVRTATSANGFPIGPWLGDDSTSDWIAPNTDSSLDGPIGAYDYQVSFSLAGLDPSTAAVSGDWSSDNEGYDILLNGHSTGQMTTGQFAAFTPFTILSGFQSGINTLDFLIYNDGGPTGVRVEMSGTAGIAGAIPEPATWALMLVGFGGMGGALRMGRGKTAAA